LLQYWGWCKHRYREVYKTRIDEARNVARNCLDSCPVIVIRQLFNRSWRFMAAYRQGLTGKAADWAVHKQKSHWKVGERAMSFIKAVLNSDVPL
jgi:hypothetical protein